VPLHLFSLRALQKKPRRLKIRRLRNPLKTLRKTQVMQWKTLLTMQATHSTKLATTLKKLRKTQATQWKKPLTTLKMLLTMLRTSRTSNRSGLSRYGKGLPSGSPFLFLLYRSEFLVRTVDQQRVAGMEA